MRPSFEQFRAALRDPSQRASIGLSISDADAAALLAQPDTMADYFDAWIARSPETAAPAPAAQAAPASRRPAGVTRMLIIGGSVVGAVLLVLIGIAVARGVNATATSHRSAAPTSPSSSDAAPTPDDLHGLSAREYPLLEAVFESEGTTIPAASARGVTDDQLRALTDTVVRSAESACAETAKLSDGFDDPTFKASFVSGYVSTSKVTPAEAAVVYEANRQYCASQ